MLRPVQKRVSSGTLKLRQREVEECLAQFGLRAGPHRLILNGESFAGDKIARLRTALESLGPVFCSFALYMSTRADLLDAKDCRQLASLTSRAQELSPTVVREQIKRELGSPPDEIFGAFEYKPFVSGLLAQHHHACLHDGLPVTIRLLRPEVEELIHYDAQLFHLLKGAFIGPDCTSAQIENAIRDFLLTLQQQTDLLVHARALTSLSDDAKAFGMLRVPAVQTQLSTARVLTIERLPGQTLEHILSAQVNKHINDNELHALAHRLCVVWLRQVLLGDVFPADPAPANIITFPSNQIAFIDGTLVNLPAEAKANLWNYLIAVLIDDPDQACSSLLKEMEVRDGSVSEAELRRKFRQFVPFRDSDWAYSNDDSGLAEVLRLHWKLINRSGYEPRVHLSSFYRGLFMIAGISRRLAHNGDPLQRALQNVRVLAEAEKLRDMLTPSRLVEQMDAYLALMMHLPQRFDQMLTVGTNGDRRRAVQVADKSETRRRKNLSAVAIALWLMFGATVLLVRHFEINLAILQSRRFESVLFVLFGAVFLLVARQRR